MMPERTRRSRGLRQRRGRCAQAQTTKVGTSSINLIIVCTDSSARAWRGAVTFFTTTSHRPQGPCFSPRGRRTLGTKMMGLVEGALLFVIHACSKRDLRCCSPRLRLVCSGTIQVPSGVCSKVICGFDAKRQCFGHMLDVQPTICTAGGVLASGWRSRCERPTRRRAQVDGCKSARATRMLSDATFARAG